jgi:phage terminase small subunit
MTPKQLLFVGHYLDCLNATEAARRAGYSDATARQAGYENLTKPDIKAAIQEELRTRLAALGVHAQRVMQEYAAIAFSDAGDVLDFDGPELKLRPPPEIPSAARRAIQSVKVKRYVESNGDAARTVELTEFKWWSKSDALLQLGKYLGLLKERVEHTGPDGGPIPIAVVEVSLSEAEPDASDDEAPG